MSTKRELLARWETEPGRSIRQKIWDLGRLMWPVGHGLRSEAILTLLDGLPFREEVPAGKDLRGLQFGALRELDLAGWDFSHGNPSDLIYCNLAGAIFNYAVVGSGAGTLSDNLDNASFFKAHLRQCYFDGSRARNCNFEKARLKKCDLTNVYLRGSCFRGAKLKGCSLVLADLRGCDFRGAVLDEVLLNGVHWDKTTDLRGATLLNVFDQAYENKRDGVVSAADWHEANYDETTRYIRDPLPEALRELGACIAATRDIDHTSIGKLEKLLRETREQIKKKFNPNWSEDLKKQLSEEEKGLLDDILGVAVEYLK